MIATIAIAMQIAKSPDDASAGEAPTARSPAMTRANELAKPEIAATNPAEIGWRTDAVRMLQA
jgi:hypothetical protein